MDYQHQHSSSVSDAPAHKTSCGGSGGAMLVLVDGASTGVRNTYSDERLSGPSSGSPTLAGKIPWRAWELSPPRMSRTAFEKSPPLKIKHLYCTFYI